MKTALVTGITGQCGKYALDRLLLEDYKVYGMIRRSSSINTSRIDDVYNDPEKSKQLELFYGDLGDSSSVMNCVGDIKPYLMLNLACQSHVKVSYDVPEYSFDIGATGTLRCLEAIRKASPSTRFLTCSSSEMFGSTPPPQNETTAFHPRSPYAVGKVAAYHAVVNYRESYNLFVSSGIFFNMESPFRGPTFITKKITKAATRIKLGLQKKLLVGNLNAKRDWNHCADSVDAMYKIITADQADDFVVASGEMHSVQEFIEIVFGKLDLDWKEYVEVSPKYFRPAEVDALCGSSEKIKNKLGWSPKYTFEQLVDEMIEYDLKEAKNEKMIQEANESK